jgi:glycosyltransferase involved in cell wall biosynthesis
MSAVRRPRIVYAVGDFEPAVGGTTRQTGVQAREFVRRGYDVSVVARRTDASWPRHEVLDGLKVYRVGPPGQEYRAHRLAVVALMFWLVRHRRKIDIFQTVLWANAATAGTLAGVINRTFVRWAIDGEATEWMAPKRKPQSALRRAGLRRARHVVLTQRMQEELAAVGLAGTVIPLAVDTTRFRPPTAEERSAARADIGCGDGEDVIVCVSHLEERKRVDRLVAAFAELDTNARLVLVGGERGAPEDRKAQLVEQVASLGVTDRVSFAGATDPLPYLWAADVFVLPSEREGMPNSILEAMACGLPCIAAAEAGGAELIDEHSGIVPPSAEPNDLADALRRILGDPAFRAEVARTVESRMLPHSTVGVVDAYERLYTRS